MTSVPTNVPVQIEFNKQISPTSLGALQLLRGSTPVSGTFSFVRNDTVVIFTPNVPLNPGTTYTISISGVQDVRGNPMASTVTKNFTTGPGVKLAAPVNISVSPCCNQTGVSDTTTIQIVFDSPMNPLTFDASLGNASLVLSGSSTVVPTTVSFSPDYKTVILTPSAPLTSATTYTILVNYAQVADIAGNTFFSSINQSFTAQ